MSLPFKNIKTIQHSSPRAGGDEPQAGQKIYVTEVQCRDAHAEKRSSSRHADYGPGMGTSSYTFDQATNVSDSDPLIDPDTGEELPF